MTPPEEGDIVVCSGGVGDLWSNRIVNYGVLDIKEKRLRQMNILMYACTLHVMREFVLKCDNDSHMTALFWF